MRAVRRAELTIFQLVVDGSMLRPVRVEFVYELNERLPRIKVFAELHEPLGLPGNPDVEIRGVSVMLDHAGNITETKAHAYPVMDLAP